MTNRSVTSLQLGEDPSDITARDSILIAADLGGHNDGMVTPWRGHASTSGRHHGAKMSFLEFSDADLLAAIEHDETRQHATAQVIFRDPLNE